MASCLRTFKKNLKVLHSANFLYLNLNILIQAARNAKSEDNASALSKYRHPVNWVWRKSSVQSSCDGWLEKAQYDCCAYVQLTKMNLAKVNSSAFKPYHWHAMMVDLKIYVQEHIGKSFPYYFFMIHSNTWNHLTVCKWMNSVQRNNNF